VLTPEQIGRFYLQWEPSEVHKDWPQLWNKHYRIRAQGDTFIKLNKHRSRLGFESLRRLCTEYAPRNVYMSALNWLMPERVGNKISSVGAYPIGGEYVFDIDSYLNYKKHNHRTTEDRVCEGCLENSKQLTEKFIDEIKTNYSDVRAVFSGKAGFHIHVLDFHLRDWVRYDERNPLKSHETA
jgi:DNA primase catalytic subunit